MRFIKDEFIHSILLKELIPFDKILYIQDFKNYVEFMGRENRYLTVVRIYNDGHVTYR